MFQISVVDDGLKIDLDLDRNWLIHSYLAGELLSIETYLIPQQQMRSLYENSQSVTFSDALNMINEQAYVQYSPVLILNSETTVRILLSKGKLAENDPKISKVKKQVVRFLSGYEVLFSDNLKEGQNYNCLLILDHFSRSDKTMYAIVFGIPILRPSFFAER